MIEDKKRQIKKFIHDNILVMVATTLFLTVLVVLILSRNMSLASIRDLSSINPLITSSQNELVAVSDSSKIIKVPTTDDSNLAEPTKVSSNTKTQSTTGGNKASSGGSGSSSSGSSGGSSGGSGSSSGGSSGGGGQASSPSPSPSSSPTPPAPFATSIGQMTHLVSGSGSILGLPCKLTHDFEATIATFNSPGTFSYQWRRSDGVTGSVYQVAVLSGETSKKVNYQWVLTGSSGNRSVTIKITAPVAQEKTLVFEHNC